MESIKKETLSQQVSAGVIAHIEKERLHPGDKLPSEKELIAKFGVSRTVVREALKSLEMLGIIYLKQGDGIYVRQPSMKDITHHISFQWKRNPKTMSELLDVRIMLEEAAVERIIRHADWERLAPAKRWNGQLEAKAREDAAAEEEDVQFHRALVQAAGNDMLLQMSDMMHGLFDRLHSKQSGKGLFSWAQSAEEHRTILRWIEQQDAAQAKQHLRDHLSKSVNGAIRE